MCSQFISDIIHNERLPRNPNSLQETPESVADIQGLQLQELLLPKNPARIQKRKQQIDVDRCLRAVERDK